jgi:hypothetical protein
LTEIIVSVGHFRKVNGLPDEESKRNPCERSDSHNLTLCELLKSQTNLEMQELLIDGPPGFESNKQTNSEMIDNWRFHGENMNEVIEKREK